MSLSPDAVSPLNVADLVAVVAVMKEQEATLRRIQAQLDALVKSLGPSAHMVVAGESTAVSDPLGAGFSMSQRALADELGVPASYVSALVRAFKLDEDPRYAVTVRPGAKRLVNYHPRAVARFRELVQEPPADLDRRALHTLEQVRARLASEPARAA